MFLARGLLGSNRSVFTFFSWLDLLGVVQMFFISILKICKLLPNYWHMVTDIISFGKHSESSSGHILSFYLNWWNIVSRIGFWRNLSSGLLRWSSPHVKYNRSYALSLWHQHRAPRRTFTEPCKPEVRPGAREESASPAWLAAPAMNACTN